MNAPLIVAVVCALLGFAGIAYLTFFRNKPKTQVIDMETVAAAMKPHIVSMFAAARADAAKARNAIASEFHHPAAPVAAAEALPPAASAVTPADSGGTVIQEKAAMPRPAPSAEPTGRLVVGASSMFMRQAPAPSGIEILNDFKSYAAAAQLFLDLPEASKWAYRNASPQLWKFDVLLGVTPGWLNAMGDSALINGQGPYTYFWDFAAKALTTRNHQVVATPVVTWRNGTPPAYYQPIAVKAATGADVVADWLTEAMALSPGLVSHGLTAEAIAAARA